MIIPHTLLVLLFAWLVTFVVCKSLRINLILGYLITGMILGPSGMNYLETSNFLLYLGEFGISLFLFTLGVEIPWHRLIALRRYIFGVGVAQVFLCALVISGILYIQPILNTQDTLFLGLLSLSLAFSSTAVIIQILSERFELTSTVGRVSLGILLFQDLAVIGMFAYLGIDMQKAPLWINLLNWCVGALLSGLWVILVSWLCKYVMRRYNQRDIGLAFIFITVLAGSFITHHFGLSSELGAFLTGVSIASTSWRHHLNDELHPFRIILFAFFFFMAGMQINLKTCLEQAQWIAYGVTWMFLAKLFVMLFLSRIWKFSWNTSLQLGILIAGSSEFLFILITNPAFKNYFSPVTQQIGFGITFCSMMLTPILFSVTRYFLKFLEHRGVFSQEHKKRDKVDVILAGFGHVGQTVALALELNFISFLVVDYDIVRLEKAKALGYPILHGEARNVEFLKKAGVGEAKILLLTFGHSSTCVELVRNIRAKFPQLYIAVHVRSAQQAQHFQGLSIFLVYPEALESGLQMAAISLECLGFSKEHAAYMAKTTPKTLFMENMERQDDIQED
ncbi:cation:proton antiporter domain-containing protein [Holospora undulata]|uniref:Glutathione-regulated potassium-efflux system protein KefB n=1 Tax=Holospora undulata HU1 TaxID=1321371 RepID=A0A061JI27_9PROT|nr:cation:proton antiporter [Holospora undulata]ETZ05128.1 glutathione-regulated potassium-efflux system protein KefB [Holospora undulata HU1]